MRKLSKAYLILSALMAIATFAFGKYAMVIGAKFPGVLFLLYSIYWTVQILFILNQWRTNEIREDAIKGKMDEIDKDKPPHP